MEPPLDMSLLHTVTVLLTQSHWINVTLILRHAGSIFWRLAQALCLPQESHPKPDGCLHRASKPAVLKPGCSQSDDATPLQTQKHPPSHNQLLSSCLYLHIPIHCLRGFIHITSHTVSVCSTGIHSRSCTVFYTCCTHHVFIHIHNKSKAGD